MTRIRHGDYLTIGLVLALVLCASAARGIDEPHGTVATYRVSVNEAELQSWLDFLGDNAPDDRGVVIEELILVKTMSDAAIESRLDLRAEVGIALERAEGAVLRGALRASVWDSITFTDEEIEAKYQAIKDTYTLPRRVRLRSIFKRYPPDASAQDRAEVREAIEDLRRRLVAGEDFADLATAESDSQTRFNGGLMGNIRAGTLRPDLDAVAMEMEPGEISDIFEVDNGLTILFCESILPPVERSPEELHDIAERLLRRREFKRRWNELELELRTAATPRFRWQRLEGSEPEPEMVLVEHPGGFLTVAELEALASRPGRQPEPILNIPKDRLVALVEQHLLVRMIRPEVTERGLLRDGELLDRLRWTRRKLLAERMLQDLAERDFDPPEEEDLRVYYDDHPDEFTRLEHYELTVIVLPVSEDDPRIAYRLGERIVTELGRGDLSFAEAARRYSEHPSGMKGGDLGWVPRNVLSASGFNLLRQVTMMSPGDVSDLVLNGEALWIVELRGVENQRRMTFEEAREKIEARLAEGRMGRLRAQVIREWILELGVDASNDAAP